ncbi:MAG: Na+/H+ antiporter [Candidatus Nanopelagicales bacterium]
MLQDSVIPLAGTAVIGVIISMFARSRGWGVSLPLVASGIVLSLLPIGPNGPEDPELILLMVLAPLVFGESLSTSFLDLKAVSRPVMALAIGLVVVSAFTVGVIASQVVAGLPFAAAVALGAILGPTDAVAVSAVAKQASLPRRLVHILEGESLVNDGTALTLLRVAVVAAAAGGVTVLQAGVTLGLAVVGGLAVGVLGGFILVTVLRRSRDTVAANGLVLVAPFPLYLGAETFEGSGILAVVVAGLMVAHATATDTRYRGRLQVGSVWRQLTFVLMSLAFLLVGVEIPDTLDELADSEIRELLLLVPIVVVTLIVTRALFVLAMMGLRSARGSRPWRDGGWKAWVVVAWAGARGPISGLAAFSLPLALDSGEPFPERNLLLAVTFCVVVITLVLSPTLGPLARLLRLPPDDDEDLLRRVRLSLARASLDRLEELVADADRGGDPLPEPVVRQLRDNATFRLNRATRAVADGTGTRSASTTQRLSRQMIRAEQEELVRMRDEEGLPDTLMRELMTEIDVRARALGIH